MYVDQNDNPVELHLNGYDFVFGSHPDIYIMKYDNYMPNFVNDSVFDAPALCNSESKPSNIHRARATLGLVNVLTPPKSEDPFDHFISYHKKVYASPQEYQYRRSVWEENAKFIEEHNAKEDKTYTVGMNHFGDYTMEEISQLFFPKPAGIDRATANKGATKYHEPTGIQLPSYVNWVEKGGVTKVKDQGICGSCWTFGTAGSIEGAYFAKTGKLVSLSEQQIVDCAWGTWVTGNSGCDGGFAGPAMQWIMDNGGMALEQTYKYLMFDHWCNADDKSSPVKLVGYVNVTEGSEEDLADAVAMMPVAVAIDVLPSFVFYTSGVYYDATCKNDINDLDHEVLAVGYGTTEDGQDYWLVKNSWSTHWGNEGFIMMARNRDNLCGIATQPNYPIVA